MKEFILSGRLSQRDSFGAFQGGEFDVRKTLCAKN